MKVFTRSSLTFPTVLQQNQAEVYKNNRTFFK